MERVLLKPRPSRKRLHHYWQNWWWKITHVPVNKRWTGTCFDCGRKGVLATELIYRGESRPRNLLCDNCWKGSK